MPLTIFAKDVKGLEPAVFEKFPKIYGILNNGKHVSLKKIKNSLSPSQVSALWAAKIKLFDKKIIKNNLTLLETTNSQNPEIVQIYLKTKTEVSQIDTLVSTVKIVSPVVRNYNTTAHPGDTITVSGLYFGTKAPKAYLYNPGNNKKIKLKTVKQFKYADIKGKSSCMDIATGISEVRYIIPEKNLISGTYMMIIDNKLGIALDENGLLPKINIIQ